MTSTRPKPEDRADGCRAFAKADRDKAAGTPNDHMRATFERSADAWTARAGLLDRLEASFNARAAAIQAQPGPIKEGVDHG
jgi:hypothetical protein